VGVRGLLLLPALLCACGPGAQRAGIGAAPPAERPFFSALPPGIWPTLPVPPDNPITIDRAELGRRLFFEKRLSRDGSVACASCHVPERAFTDGRPLAVGVDGRVGRRNAPTLLNRAYAPRLFWDGRAGSLEAQALVPMESPVELGSTHDEIVRRLRSRADYRRLFRRAFGSEDILIERVAAALASFQRTLVSGGSAFDRYAMLGDSSALDVEARRGLELFRGKGRCSLCHDGLLLSDERFHNTGVAWRDGAFRDSGRALVTGRLEDVGAFRTPTLRDVDRTAPYMHDGSLATLEDVVEFYVRGGTPNPGLDPALRPLALDPAERRALVVFLRALTAGERSAFRPQRASGLGARGWPASAIGTAVRAALQFALDRWDHPEGRASAH
jgi:cytochrome c peroxidase